MIQVQIDTTGQTDMISVTVPLNDDQMADIERALGEWADLQPGGMAQYKQRLRDLWSVIRFYRLEINRVAQQLPNAMGGRRDYYEVSDMLYHRQGKS